MGGQSVTIDAYVAPCQRTRDIQICEKIDALANACGDKPVKAIAILRTRRPSAVVMVQTERVASHTDKLRDEPFHRVLVEKIRRLAYVHTPETLGDTRPSLEFDMRTNNLRPAMFPCRRIL